MFDSFCQYFTHPYFPIAPYLDKLIPKEISDVPSFGGGVNFKA